MKFNSFSDVVVGSILGSSIAFVTYKLHYPNDDALDMPFSATQNLH